ncbi:MAG TPA: hypothetical protein VFN37_11120 [Candidatus Baltobacteraceae bacterium]|nr:hypothetical protein [Candidatus Baltobacteraceae bacterium]
MTATAAAELLTGAQDAERRAQRDDALALLAECSEWPAPYSEQGLLLRADVLTARDAIAGLQELAAHADAFTSHDGRIGYLTASARAYMKARNFDAAEAMLESAQAESAGETEPRRHEIAYARARLRWNLREYDPQDADIAVALRSPDPGLRFLALNLRAWMHAGLEDYRAQLNDLLECVRIYREHGHRCGIASVAMSLHTTFVAGWELHEPAAVREAEAAFDTVEWTPDIRVYRFLSLRALAWHAFLQGDSARAQWLLKDSKDDAPTRAWKVMAHVDRAYVARINGNEAWVAEELHEAHTIAHAVDWHSTRDEERMALITLALLLAPTDLGHAQRYVSTYIELGANNLHSNIEASHEPRRNVAHQKYAAGRVHAMLGDTQLATRALEEAYRIFSSIDHEFRAALVSQALHEITGDPRWLENARAHASKFPNSALAHRLNTAEPGKKDDNAHGLSSLQRQIAIAYCQGVDVLELSRRFSRSSFTIGKQLDAIYLALGVTSRPGLREELHRRGVL